MAMGIALIGEVRKMGEIIYKPHCSKCGAVINQEIAYRINTDESRKTLFLSYFSEIDPNRCPRCGEIFGTIKIIMPKELD